MKKGTTNNPNGRPKGVPNKTTAELRELVSQIFAENMETLRADLQALEPQERVKIILQLATYILPKPTETPLSKEEKEGLAEYKGELYWG